MLETDVPTVSLGREMLDTRALICRALRTLLISAVFLPGTSLSLDETICAFKRNGGRGGQSNITEPDDLYDRAKHL